MSPAPKELIQSLCETFNKPADVVLRNMSLSAYKQSEVGRYQSYKVTPAAPVVASSPVVETDLPTSTAREIPELAPAPVLDIEEVTVTPLPRRINKTSRSFLTYMEGFCYENSCSTITELNCGDLTTRSGPIYPLVKYTGVDVSDAIISANQRAWPTQTFLHNPELTSLGGDIIIITDIITGMDYESLLTLLESVAGRFRYYAVGSDIVRVNDPASALRNLFIAPFYFRKFTIKLGDAEFNRLLCVMTAEQFQTNLGIAARNIRPAPPNLTT